jgi:magnesium transporter
MKKRYSYSKKINLPPGSLVYTGLQTEPNPEITAIKYSESHYEKTIIEKEEKIIEFSKNDDITQVNWLNLKGISSIKLIEEIGNSFKFHPLLMEDLLNPNQRPKVEEYEDMIFIVLRRIAWDTVNSDLSSEQLSFILTGSKLISFQEKNDELFSPIEQRLEKSKGRIRASDSFYLLYSIMDMIIDRYFLVLEQIEEKIDEIELNLQDKVDSIDVKEIHDLKHAMTVFKKYV